MPILALDFGEKRIGLALSDPENRIALKFKTLPNKGEDWILKELKNICQEENIKTVVIGLPKSLAGPDSLETKKVRSFAECVRINLAIKVELEDERLTTKEALKLGIKDLDQESARLILQTYLDKLNLKKFREPK